MLKSVSIVITVYNTESYIQQCLESVCNQTFSDLEIIIVNDGSDDGSLSICREYAEKDTRIILIDSSHKGVVEARKTGFRIASGEYISIIDSDDWLEPDMIEKLVGYSRKYNSDISMCGRFEDSLYSSKSVCQGINPGLYLREDLIREVFPNMIVNKSFFEWGIFPSLWDKLFRRESLDPYIFQVDPIIPMGNDAACVFPALLRVNSIYITSECLYHYRQNPHSMVRSVADTKNIKNGFYTLYHHTLRYFEDNISVYDFREQWLEYILFLMIPRSDVLYGQIEQSDYLFPFKNLKKGSRIALYGMGLFGQRLYSFFTKTGYCDVVAIFDQNYSQLNEMGIPANNPDNINCFDFDEIVIALSFFNNISAVKKYLSSLFPLEHIHSIDIDFIKEKKNLKALGLYR